MSRFKNSYKEWGHENKYHLAIISEVKAYKSIYGHHVDFLDWKCSSVDHNLFDSLIKES